MPVRSAFTICSKVLFPFLLFSAGQGVAGLRLGLDAGNIRRDLAAGFQLAPEPPQFLVDALNLACHIFPRPFFLVKFFPLFSQGVYVRLERRAQHGELRVGVDVVGLQ